MGRHAKVKNWTADKDLHIIRMSEQSIVNRIKNKQEGVYYFIDIFQICITWITF